MGEIEIGEGIATIHSHLITYGDASDVAVTELIRSEIETAWNELHGIVQIRESSFVLVFRISASHQPAINPLDVYQNLDPKNNYFRIEAFANHNISFVDGLGSNSGYFLLENLYPGSTTAAHEYGHTLGLPHPADMDYRGKGVPGIMFPRGTLVDPMYQYDPSKPAGITGGTMHPRYRKVRQEDINDLKIGRLRFREGKAVLGEFTNVYHEKQQPDR